MPLPPLLAFSTIIEEYTNPYIEFNSSAMVIVLKLVPPEVRCDWTMIASERELRALTELSFEVSFLAMSEFDARAKVDNTDVRKDSVTISA